MASVLVIHIGGTLLAGALLLGQGVVTSSLKRTIR